ncbi:hypothetical protein Hdeb2414_s0015g00451561 [Helianthus debilis subsp. tardiflorus]
MVCPPFRTIKPKATPHHYDQRFFPTCVTDLRRRSRMEITWVRCSRRHTNDRTCEIYKFV